MSGPPGTSSIEGNCGNTNYSQNTCCSRHGQDYAGTTLDGCFLSSCAPQVERHAGVNRFNRWFSCPIGTYTIDANQQRVGKSHGYDNHARSPTTRRPSSTTDGSG